MKSQVQMITKVVQALIKDAQVTYPTMSKLFRLDEDRLLTLVQSRGIGTYSLDLPNLDSLLLAGLRDGRLSLEGPLSNAVSKRIRVPRLFSGLWLRVFDKQGCLKADYDPTSVAFLRQIFCFGKKIEVMCSPKRLQATEEAYCGIESETRRPTYTWDSDLLDDDDGLGTVHFRDGMDSHFWRNCGSKTLDYALRLGEICDELQRISGEVSAQLGYYDPYSFTGERLGNDQAAFKHGPGAVSDLKFGANKFKFPNWPDKLSVLFPIDAFGSYNHVLPDWEVSSEEKASKLIAVPKTAKAPRLIASEPVAHQWCQQITWKWLNERIQKSKLISPFLDFSSQEASRKLTLQASLNGELATVDLSSASDRLSCWVVERIFRSNRTLLDALHAHRTRKIMVNLTGRRILLSQKKFASQGTAVTFPIQSLVFFCCAMAVLPGRGLKDKVRRYKGRVRIYGDDIILPKSGYDDLRLLLDFLGLKVNDDKSFMAGPFRESCGMDALAGYDVTPCKPKSLRSDTPTAKIALVDLSNNLFTKGYWKAAKAVESIMGFPPKGRLPIVGIGSGVTGRASFCGPSLTHLDKRWNEDLHRHEARVWTTVSSCPRKPISDTTAFFQFLTERPQPDTKWQSGTAVRPKVREGLRWECVENLAEPVNDR